MALVLFEVLSTNESATFMTWVRQIVYILAGTHGYHDEMKMINILCMVSMRDCVL